MSRHERRLAATHSVIADSLVPCFPELSTPALNTSRETAAWKAAMLRPLVLPWFDRSPKLVAENCLGAENGFDMQAMS